MCFSERQEQRAVLDPEYVSFISGFVDDIGSFSRNYISYYRSTFCYSRSTTNDNYSQVRKRNLTLKLWKILATARKPFCLLHLIHLLPRSLRSNMFLISLQVIGKGVLACKILPIHSTSVASFGLSSAARLRSIEYRSLLTLGVL